MTELTDSTRARLDKLPARVIVEYLAERFGPEVGQELVERAAAGEPLPPDTRSLLEAIAERLDMGSGQWRLDATFDDGRLRRLDRHHQKIAPTKLDGFDLRLPARPGELPGGPRGP